MLIVIVALHNNLVTIKKKKRSTHLRFCLTLQPPPLTYILTPCPITVFSDSSPRLILQRLWVIVLASLHRDFPSICSTRTLRDPGIYAVSKLGEREESSPLARCVIISPAPAWGRCCFYNAHPPAILFLIFSCT